MNEDPVKKDESTNEQALSADTDSLSPENVTEESTTQKSMPPTPSQTSIVITPQDVQQEVATPESISATNTTIALTPDALPSFQPPTGTSHPATAQPQAPTSLSAKPKFMLMLIFALVGVIVLVVLAFVTYKMGNSRGYKNGKAAESMAATAALVKVPAGATMISQCSPGEGTQYVLPRNIPTGPIYNVWQGKVTGLEYMLSQSEIAGSKAVNLSAISQNYNHIDIMYEAAGHAGFTEPHYHVVLSLIPYSSEQQIACGSASSPSMM